MCNVGPSVKYPPITQQQQQMLSAHFIVDTWIILAHCAQTIITPNKQQVRNLKQVKLKPESTS